MRQAGSRRFRDWLRTSNNRTTSGSGDAGPRRGALRAILLAILVLAAPMGATAQSGRPLRLVALGDSLVAGYGLPAGAAFPAVLERALRARGYDVAVRNAGRNGDTASGGFFRVDTSVPSGTDGVILELGANDMLRGVDPSVTRAALSGIISRLRRRGIPVLLAGMRSLPDRGPAYVSEFEAIYPDLARRYGLVYYPFFLNGVAFVGPLNLSDGVHPNAAGVQAIVANMLPTVEQFLARLTPRGGITALPRASRLPPPHRALARPHAERAGG